ncbi:MAG: Mur ligase domain-containing protein [Candidatus Kaiserbacteria bacterium]|nr:Mur ligase domain-containing protein [Candidatus Kaiserbacteria bacterium]
MTKGATVFRSAYFVGVGGIGMSALAQYFKDHGVMVSGSDREASPVTELLESKGITVFIGQKAEQVSADTEVVVYSDAVPPENPERARAQELGIPQYSYFEMLGEVSKGPSTSSGQGRRTVAVAGTHGKTTTTGMLARILGDAGASPTAIIGSIVKDFGSNYLAPSTSLGAGGHDIFVVEACEYRDHLLELTPQVLVITNLEWDHTDYFPSLAALQETFRKAIERVPADGVIVTNPNDANIAPCLPVGRRFSNGPRVIDYTQEPAYELRLPGEFNVMNARAAAAAARVVFPALSDATLVPSLAEFQGTWRRFEYKGKTQNGAEVYDDYAHHPTAVRETLKALREKVKGKIVVAFHPHLYSRTRDLLDEFATAFADADQVLLAPIYAAREVDDGSISSELLAERIRATGTDAVALESFDAIERELREAGAGTTIMTMGAGDIYKIADTLIV